MNKRIELKSKETDSYPCYS